MQHYLEIPFYKIDALKEKYKLTPIKGGITIYSGTTLPRELRSYSSEDFSYARWLEDERNAFVMPTTKTGTPIFLKPHQREAVKSITTAYNNDFSGFIISDHGTLGKGVAATTAVAKIAQEAGFGERTRAKTLIVATPSSLASWREQLRHLPNVHAYLRIMLIDYTSLTKIISAPPQARVSHKKTVKVKQTALNGVSSTDWNYIIFDDSYIIHDYQNSNAAKQAAIVAKLNMPYVKGNTPFSVFCTSVLDTDPVKNAVYAKILGENMLKKLTPGERHNQALKLNVKDWPELLLSCGYSVHKSSRGKWQWAPVDDNRAKQEVKSFDNVVKASSSSVLRRDRNNLPSKDVFKYSKFFIEAKGSQRESYHNMWKNISQRLINKEISAAEAVSEYQQRSIYLKFDSVVQLIQDLLPRNGLVIVKLPTRNAADELASRLLKKRVQSFVYFSGELTQDDLQDGKVKVLITTNNMSKIDASWLKQYKNPVFVLMDYMNANVLTTVRLAEHMFYNPSFYLPMFVGSVDERLGRIIISSTVNTKQSEVAGYIERSLKLAAAKTPPPMQLS